jgi:hypothetical protein
MWQSVDVENQGVDERVSLKLFWQKYIGGWEEFHLRDYMSRVMNFGVASKARGSSDS